MDGTTAAGFVTGPRTDAGAPVIRVLLTGMMGSGKTTIGLGLARRTGWPYIDNDELLRQTTGLTARQLLAAGGESDLRAGEAAVVERALELPPPVFVGIAAGVIVDPLARERMRRAGHVVWLRARPETLLGRLGPGDHRPFMGANLPKWVTQMAADRAPLYEEVASIIVDVDERPPTAIVDEILARLPVAGEGGGG